MPSKSRSKQVEPEDPTSRSDKGTTRKGGPGSRTTTACVSCKKRKTKCTGGPPPCDLCESLGTECIIDSSLDMRRRSAIQRTLDETKVHQQTLHSLIERLRDDDSMQMARLVENIRAFPSTQDAEDSLTDILRRPLEEEDAIEKAPFDMTSDEPKSLSQASSVSGGQVFHTETVSSLTSGMSQVNPQIASARTSAILNAEGGSVTTGAQVRSSDDPEFLEQIISHFPVAAQSPETTLVTQSDVDEVNMHRRSWHQSLLLPNYGGYGIPNTVEPKGKSKESSRSLTQIWTSPRQSKSLHTQDHIDVHVCQPGQSGSDGSFRQPDLVVVELQVPIHCIRPRYLKDMTPITGLYMDYLRLAKHMIAAGTPSPEILGQGQVVVDIFFRAREPSDNYTCCSWASEFMRLFPEYDQFVGLACCYFLCNLMRWLLVPTAENYHNVPEMIRPTPSQCLVPHMAGIDTCPIPAIRDALIQDLRDWVTALSHANCSVNWPFSLDAALETDLVTQQLKLTKEFELHVANHNNWSLEPSILQVFPEVSGRIRIVNTVVSMMAEGP